MSWHPHPPDVSVGDGAAEQLDLLSPKREIVVGPDAQARRERGKWWEAVRVVRVLDQRGDRIRLPRSLLEWLAPRHDEDVADGCSLGKLAV